MKQHMRQETMDWTEGCLGVALGYCLVLLLVWGLSALSALGMGLVAHLVFPQWGYWQEAGLIFLVLTTLQMLFGKGGSSK